MSPNSDIFLTFVFLILKKKQHRKLILYAQKKKKGLIPNKDNTLQWDEKNYLEMALLLGLFISVFKGWSVSKQELYLQYASLLDIWCYLGISKDVVLVYKTWKLFLENSHPTTSLILTMSISHGCLCRTLVKSNLAIFCGGGQECIPRCPAFCFSGNSTYLLNCIYKSSAVCFMVFFDLWRTKARSFFTPNSWLRKVVQKTNANNWKCVGLEKQR